MPTIKKSDTEQSESIQQAKTSKLAIASLIFALLSVISLSILPSIIVDDISFLIFLISAPLAIVSGIVSIFTAVKSKGWLKSIAPAIIAIAISGFLAAYVIYVIVKVSRPGCTFHPILYKISMKSPKTRSYYAINPETNWNLPPDMVLLL